MEYLYANYNNCWYPLKSKTTYIQLLTTNIQINSRYKINDSKRNTVTYFVT